jgi:hypothetical protein
LLVGREQRGGVDIRNAGDHQSTIEAPDKASPESVLTVLIAEIRGGLEGLIVVDAKDARNIRGSLENQAADLRRFGGSDDHREEASRGGQRPYMDHGELLYDKDGLPR